MDYCYATSKNEFMVATVVADYKLFPQFAPYFDYIGLYTACNLIDLTLL